MYSPATPPRPRLPLLDRMSVLGLRAGQLMAWQLIAAAAIVAEVPPPPAPRFPGVPAAPGVIPAPRRGGGVGGRGGGCVGGGVPPRSPGGRRARAGDRS